MIEIRKDGRVILTIHSVGPASSEDIVTVIRNSSMSTAAFDELYEKYMQDSGSYKEAYERLEKLHETLFGARKYSEFSNYKSSRSHRGK